MSVRALSLETPTTPPWHLRPAALTAVGIARLLTYLPPQRLRKVLECARRGSRPATETKALRARNAVVAVSVPCAGPRCLQRSIATALLCRMTGTWPDWCTGVRTQPFQAHAWVEVDGKPIGENIDEIRYFHVLMTVRSRR
ncbi:MULTISPECIES: lasso peptide biosynthesis B2 protein [Streptomyces violaceusniger group]|uniref:Microcin J25-processing protein McjB C-terminal domain-containing protein n=2 Tax=Streptomyces rhizosphaericus TaxID=114699 RepID=A0ABP4CGP3_9ACTN|nr:MULTISPECIES: lasso peptide biosynthesis B2 protein [Streptomyces violaceusniger group]